MLEAQPAYFLFPLQLKKKQTQILETKPFLIGEGESREWWGALFFKKKKAKQEAGREVELTWRLQSIWKKQISIVNLKK